QVRISRPVSPRNPSPGEDDSGKNRDPDWEREDQRPPGLDVHGGEDGVSEGSRVSEPKSEGAHREDERKGDLAPRPRASLPRSGESAHDDRTDDHHEQEVEGQMVCYDQAPGHQEKRDDGASVRTKPYEEKKAGHGEEIAEGRRRRVRGRVDVRIGTGEKGRGEERKTVLRDDSSGEEEHW